MSGSPPIDESTKLLSNLSRQTGEVQDLNMKFLQGIMQDFAALTVFVNDRNHHGPNVNTPRDQFPGAAEYTMAKHNAVVGTARDHILALEVKVGARKVAFIRDMRDLLKKIEGDGR